MAAPNGDVTASVTLSHHITGGLAASPIHPGDGQKVGEANSSEHNLSAALLKPANGGKLTATELKCGRGLLETRNRNWLLLLAAFYALRFSHR